MTKIEWAKRTLENEDNLPWADVAKAREILGLPKPRLTEGEQKAYEAYIEAGRKSAEARNQRDEARAMFHAEWFRRARGD